MSEANREAFIDTVGQDGFLLWEVTNHFPQPELLRMIPAMETLHQVWLQQYYLDDGELRWRQSKNLPPARRGIISPHDTEARFSVRRSTKWEGYRVHVTETCDEDRPLLITNVETTTSASLDLEWTDAIHQRLQERDLLPKVHLVDGGCVDARALAEGESIYGLDLIGPTKLDPSWQARRGVPYGLSSFVIDWEKEQAICPQGQPSLGWYPCQNPYG
jgi:transposase